MLRFLKPLSFIPAIVVMYMIFSFSGQDGTASSELSYKVSYKIVETAGHLLGEEWEPQHIDSIAQRYHGTVRKIAHMTEYFILAVTVSFPLYVYGLRGILLILIAGLFCVAFACGDEYHQSFIEGRGPSKRDVAIDSFGVFWGIIGVRIVGFIGRKTIFRPWKKKAPASQPAMQYQQPYYPEPQFQNPQYQNPQYQNPQYQNPQYQNPQYQDPRYQNAQYQQPYYQEPVYYQEEYPQERPVNPAPRQKRYSDQLSEDMSLKKLMQDLKAQKKEPRTMKPGNADTKKQNASSYYKEPAKTPDIYYDETGMGIDEIDRND